MIARNDPDEYGLDLELVSAKLNDLCECRPTPWTLIERNPKVFNSARWRYDIGNYPLSNATELAQSDESERRS
jgi:hypothetical protein